MQPQKHLTQPHFSLPLGNIGGGGSSFGWSAREAHQPNEGGGFKMLRFEFTERTLSVLGTQKWCSIFAFIHRVSHRQVAVDCYNMDGRDFIRLVVRTFMNPEAPEYIGALDGTLAGVNLMETAHQHRDFGMGPWDAEKGGFLFSSDMQNQVQN